VILESGFLVKTVISIDLYIISRESFASRENDQSEFFELFSLEVHVVDLSLVVFVKRELPEAVWGQSEDAAPVALNAVSALVLALDCQEKFVSD
jgi:hypothetical protein